VKRKADPAGQNGAASTYVPARATIVKGVVIVVRECWLKARRRYAVYERCLAKHSYDAVVSVSAVRHSADCESVSAAMPGVRCAVLWRESDSTTLPWLSSCRLVTFNPAR